MRFRFLVLPILAMLLSAGCHGPAPLSAPEIEPKRLVETLTSTSQIWSPSGQEKAMAERMLSEFTRLQIQGLRMEVDDSAGATGSDSGNVIVDIPASPNAPSNAKAICLCFHLDRVPVRAPGVPPDEAVQIEVTEEGRIRSRGSRTNIGADDRNGYAAIKEALRVMQASGLVHGPIRVIGFVCEETGLRGARHLSPKYLKGLDYGFDVDGGPPGNIVRACAAMRRFRAEIRGNSAPSVRPKGGKSALLAGLQVVDRLQASPLPDGLLNVSNFNSGTSGHDGSPITNVVPDRATVAGELRSLKPDVEAALQARVESACREVEQAQGVQISLSFESIPGFELSPDSPVVKFCEEATRSARVTAKVVTSMAGYDASFLNAKGLPTVCVGSGVYLQHTEREFTTRTDLVETTQVVLSLINTSACSK